MLKAKPCSHQARDPVPGGGLPLAYLAPIHCPVPEKALALVLTKVPYGLGAKC